MTSLCSQKCLKLGELVAIELFANSLKTWSRASLLNKIKFFSTYSQVAFLKVQRWVNIGLYFLISFRWPIYLLGFLLVSQQNGCRCQNWGLVLNHPHISKSYFNQKLGVLGDKGVISNQFCIPFEKSEGGWESYVKRKCTQYCILHLNYILLRIGFVSYKHKVLHLRRIDLFILRSYQKCSYTN